MQQKITIHSPNPGKIALFSAQGNETQKIRVKINLKKFREVFYKFYNSIKQIVIHLFSFRTNFVTLFHLQQLLPRWST